MIFDLIKETAKLAGTIVGTVTGPIIGLTVKIIAETLNITEAMVQEAKRAGCESYEDIKEFFEL